MLERRCPYRGVVFIHIPKTAGTSVRFSLQELFRKRLHIHPGERITQYSDEVLAAHDLIHGHFNAGDVERPVLDEYLRVVVLRDPIDRFLSVYRFAHYALDKGKANDIQRYASTVGAFEFFTSEFGSGRNAQLRKLGLEIGQREDEPQPAEWLKRAQERLSTMVVGVFPHLDPFLQYIAQTFGHDRCPVVPSKNVTPLQYRTAELTSDQIAIMKDVLRADYELFEFACARARVLYGLPEASHPSAP